MNPEDITNENTSHPGTKNPLRVQWASNERLGDWHPAESDHALDEHGLDPAAFRNLTHALEMHTVSPSTSNSSNICSPSQSVQGEHFIEPGESAGVPLPYEADNDTHTQGAAARVVSAHTRRGFWPHRRTPRQQQNHKRNNIAMERPGIGDIERDAENEASAPRPRGGPNGMLSALLTLYNQQNTPSGASTPSHASPNLTIPPSPPRLHPVPRSLSVPDIATPKIPTSSSTPSLLGRRPRGGGALGALIASTGNISGAAAPVNATLAPNMKRPGYHLSRYSLQEVPGSKKEKGGASGSGSSTPRADSEGSRTPERASPATEKKKWNELLKDLPSGHALRGSRMTDSSTPTAEGDWEDEKASTSGDSSRKKWKRRKAELFITRHVAQIMQRQEFILKLARAMMMFGAPSHRLQGQLQSTARVLDIELSCMYLPDMMLISFDDSSTGTSNVKFIRQGSALDLGKLQDSYQLYWKVIHDEISVSEACTELDRIMRKKPMYNWWQLILIGGLCSASICSVSFNGSFIDSLVSVPLGGLLVAIQLLSVRNELYSNMFEITIATLLSFVSAALAETHLFCYTAVASSSVVLILPGFIVLCGSLEITSRNIVSGAVRLCFALMYALFLGFGLAIGGEIYQLVATHKIYGAQDYICESSHNGPWWRRTPSIWWAFLTVPMYSLFLSMRNQAPINRKEIILVVVISCIGWVTNHFASTKFANQSDLSSAVGAFAVGVVANIWARCFSGNAFVIMITGILFQLPSGLGNGGLLTFASKKSAGSSSSYLSGFETALQLISVSIGLTVGLGIALVLVHPIQSRRRAGGVFSL